MQTVVYSNTYKSIHPVFNEMDRFYSLTSEKQYKNNSLLKDSFDTSFSDMLSLFHTYGKVKYNFNLVDKHYKPLDLPEYPEDNIIVALSGGKDSIAAAVYYVEEGYNVYLYHLRGYNTAYPDEYKQAAKIAEYLDLPIYIDTVTVRGKHEWEMTHPLKGMLLYNRMLQWGIRNSVGCTIATGNFSEASMTEDIFNREASDTVLFDDAYSQIVRSIVPNFEALRCLVHPYETDEIMLEHPELLELSQSCMCQQRFREYNKKRTEEKYGIMLPPNRCGGCSKCAVEYIHYADHGLYEFNEQYYIRCLQTLLDNQTKKWVHDAPIEDIESLFEKHLTYSINQSKIHEKLLKLSIIRGKIK